jgi:hypothetical protein
MAFVVRLRQAANRRGVKVALPRKRFDDAKRCAPECGAMRTIKRLNYGKPFGLNGKFW